jgi:hypothetical protein
MAYHSKNGQEFVGLRSQVNGCHQIVYDNQPGPRVVFAIKDPKANLQDIDDALREGVSARNVLSGVLTALKSRDIGFEYPI